MQFLKSYYICYKSFYSAVIPVVMAIKKLKKRKKGMYRESCLNQSKNRFDKVTRWSRHDIFQGTTYEIC